MLSSGCRQDSLHSLHPALQLKGPPPVQQPACLQIYQPGIGLNFHFDKDEHCMKDRREMVHPELSSVLYLTGSESPEQQLGTQSPGVCLRAYMSSYQLRLSLGALAPAGPTVILDQLFDINHGPVPDSPTGCVLAWPAANRYCIFDGRLGHGVLDSPCQDLRATLLINFWRSKPQARPELLLCSASARLLAQSIAERGCVLKGACCATVKVVCCRRSIS